MITTLPPSPPWTPVDSVAGPTPSSDTSEDDKPSVSQSDGQSVPALIPLPPSPVNEKPSLPFRRPPSVPHSSRRVSSNTRNASGRRVSAALQYALQNETHREVSESSSLDLAYYEQMREEAIDPHEAQEDRPQWDSTVGFGGTPPDTSDGVSGIAEDEAWMRYVRQQLNTLFPDLIEEDPVGSGVPALEEEGDFDVSVSTIATDELPTPPLTGMSGTLLPMRGNRVPNVREEISGLREEIERMRGVVSGLAEGLRPGLPAGAPGEQGIAPSAAFYQTANMSADIIRILSQKVDGITVDGPKEDDWIFSEENLARLTEVVASLPPFEV